MYNIVFLGQGPIASECLKHLSLVAKKSSWNVCGIVSNDNFYGQATALFNNAVDFIPNSTRNEEAILHLIDKHRVNLLLSVQHQWIISENIIASVSGLAFNLHNAKLPDYKGYNCISHAIINGEKSYTSTVHWMIAEVDMGCIAYEHSFPIEAEDTAQSVYNKSLVVSTENFQRLINDLQNGRAVPRKAITTQGTFYGRKDIAGLKKIINPLDHDEMDRKSRAFYFPPHEPAYIETKGGRIYTLPEAYQRHLENQGAHK